MKLLAFVLLVLVGSMILTSMPSQIYADPQLNSLLRIANQAQDNIKIRLSQLPSIPDEIAKLYELGSVETDALAQSVAHDDISFSRQHFLSAMKIFRAISDMLNRSVPDQPRPEPEQPRPDLERPRKAIDRIENAGNKLKTVVAQKNMNVDFAEFDRLIQNARENLEAGNINEVYKTLELAKQFMLEITKLLKPAQNLTTNEVPSTPQASGDATKDSARDSKLERIKIKIQNLEEQLNRLSDKASGNDVASQWIKRAFSLIEKAQEQLDKSPEKAMRTLNEVDKIMRMIQRIVQ